MTTSIARFGRCVFVLSICACDQEPPRAPNLPETHADAADRPLVSLRDVDPTILQEMRYFSGDNFVGTRIDGYLALNCLLSKPAALAMAAAQREAQQRGYDIKVYDCYRPQRAVAHFARWAEDSDDVLMKKRFYPAIDKSRLFELGYIAHRSGHSRGSTVDITLVPHGTELVSNPHSLITDADCRGLSGERAPDSSIDMGTGYDCFDELANTANPDISRDATANRQLLKTIMENAGFVNYSAEWWHYTLGEEPFPEQYFDFVVE